MTERPPLILVPQPWAEEALCAGRDTDDYAVENLPHHVGWRGNTASQLCRGCPVMGECAWYAWTTDSSGYVFGGIPIPYLDPEPARAQLLRVAAQRGIPEAITELTKTITQDSAAA